MGMNLVIFINENCSELYNMTMSLVIFNNEHCHKGGYYDYKHCREGVE